MPRRPDLPRETLEERWQLEAQTARNLEAFEAEREGRLDDAIALYERNVAESFPGDLPYGRLVAIYERAADLDAAERVLRRAIAVFESTTRRTPAGPPRHAARFSTTPQIARAATPPRQARSS